MKISGVEAGNFFKEVSESIEEVAQQFQDIVINDLDTFWQEFFEFIDPNGDYSGGDNPEFVNDFLNPKVEPTLENYAACRGCSNYHGRMYSGQIFICAMHPYGVTDDTCPDWEESTIE